jgi:hypothetical protein
MNERMIESIQSSIKKNGAIVVFLVNGALKTMRSDHPKLDIVLKDPSMRRRCLGTYDERATAEMIADDLRAVG